MSRRSDNPATNELLANGIGKDLSTELSNPVHRAALEHITAHLKIGKFAFSDNDEKVRTLHETNFELNSYTFSSFLLLAYSTSDAGADASRIGANTFISTRLTCDFATESDAIATSRNSVPKSPEITRVQWWIASAAAVESIRRRERRGAQQYINSGQYTNRSIWTCKFGRYGAADSLATHGKCTRARLCETQFTFSSISNSL